MEHEKHGNSDISSPENDQKSNEDSSGVGRSYECNFCKRGFTNAQALGGHMNIHRKDKAKVKAKHKNLQEEPSNVHNIKPNENYAGSLRYLPDQTNYYRPPSGQVNYQVYLPSSSPSFQTGNYFSVEGTGVDPNLSLRIGISPPVEDEDTNHVKENEVDLELRLGHDP
ncbi:hypothetical protein CDL12_25333 [Handroanthus impetiginosus]|uniref:C2H2-type domain-containing protein n=1 Tax=Handroanthus impetiginosus TaxID=429701 RepID=A0A2G9GA64_9LAMI|nr:hypothetical protein CDL12_25333 [Handroanthus impetiginosus]